MKLYLASESPRRKSILHDVGYDFTVTKAPFDESTIDLSNAPAEKVLDIAMGKASSAYETMAESDRQDAIILAADTIVVCDGKVMLKPKDEKEAITMLQSLSGRQHEVYTAVAIVSAEKKISFSVVTDVYFRELSEKEITDYVNSKEPLDKAGAYGIQGKGCLFVEKINGDYFNVVGLPISRVSEELLKFGISPVI